MPRTHRAIGVALAASAIVAALPAAAGAATPDAVIARFKQDVGAAAQVVTSRASDRATFISGDVAPSVLGATARTTSAVADAALGRYAGALGTGASSSELRRATTTTDATGAERVVYDQVVGGVPVWERRVVVALAPGGGGLRAIASGFLPGVPASLDTTPTVTQQAADLAAGAAGLGVTKLAPTQLVVFPGEQPDPAKAKLAWAVDLHDATKASHEVVMVDARTGEQLARLDRVADARDRRTYTANNGTRLPGTLLLSEGSSTAGVDADAAAVHGFVGETYDYYASTFGRDSYDDAGATLISTVHYDRNYENAYWDGTQMVYGDGFATDDVTAHELTHAVTERTAGLNYSAQSGALNEALSDMAGWDVDPGDSTLGEDLPIGAIRDMEDPARYGQPAAASQYVCTTSDNGGVHTNSGIPNKVYANLVDTLGRSAAEQVRYRAQTTYLQPSSTFADARAAFVQAASDLGVDTTRTAAAWQAQGVTANWAPSCGLLGLGVLGIF